MIVLTLLSLLLLSGCKTLNVYTVVGVENDTYTVYDNSLCYTYDGSLSEGFMPSTNVSNILPIESYGTSFNLEFEEHCKYSGSLLDAIGYYNLLVSKGYSRESIVYNSTYLDAVLISTEGDKIRILYLGNQTVRVFYKSTANKRVFPPYIFEEG